MIDHFSNVLDPIARAFQRAGDLAISPEYLPYTVGALFLGLVAAMRWRKATGAARA
jgi:hypothetical protein